MQLPVIILAGGKGTRVKKITKNHPKALLKFYNKPFIEYQINYLIKQNVKQIIVSIRYKPKEFLEYFKKKKFDNIKIRLIKDGKDLVGTGGAVKKILNKVNQSCFIIYGDSYLPINFSKIKDTFIKNKKKPIMVIYKNNNEFDKSNVYIKGNKFIYDKFNKTKKMQYIDYGLSILNSKDFKSFKNKKSFDLSEVYNKLSVENKMNYKKVNKKFYEIGSYKGIKNFKRYIKKNEIHK